MLRLKNKPCVTLSNFVSLEWVLCGVLTDPSDNTHRYGPAAIANHHAMHRRSGSMSHHIEGLHPGPELSALIRPAGTPNIVEADVFPPSRSHAPDPSIFLPYIAEDIAFEEEYEEYLSDMGWNIEQIGETQGSGGGTSAWHRLPELVSEMTEGISDSESIGSIGDLGDDARHDPNRDEKDENLTNWEVRFKIFDYHHVCYNIGLASESENDGGSTKVPPRSQVELR